MNNERDQQVGFTLLELLLSLTLVGILAGFSLPISQQWIQVNDVDIAATTIRQSLRRAQLLAQAVDGDASWGLSIDEGDNNKIILFQGESFSNRNVEYDEEFDLPDTITLSGIGEIVFSQFSGLPDVTGTIILTTDTNQTRTVTLNTKGIVDYE